MGWITKAGDWLAYVIFMAIPLHWRLSEWLQPYTGRWAYRDRD